MSRRAAARWLSASPLLPPTADQMARHAVTIADALAEGRVADALDMLADADDIGARGVARSPLLDLYRAALLPAAEDYVLHTGDASPVPAGTLVAVDLGDGQPLVDLAGALAWGSGLGPDGEGRIHRYAVVPLQH